MGVFLGEGFLVEGVSRRERREGCVAKGERNGLDLPTAVQAQPFLSNLEFVS
jgi:hypothetical protein